MHGIESFLVWLPFFGLVAVVGEIVLRDPNILFEIVSDSEAFARANAPAIDVAAPLPGDQLLHA